MKSIINRTLSNVRRSCDHRRAVDGVHRADEKSFIEGRVEYITGTDASPHKWGLGGGEVGVRPPIEPQKRGMLGPVAALLVSLSMARTSPLSIVGPKVNWIVSRHSQQIWSVVG